MSEVITHIETETGVDDMLINIGPQHPSTHGVLHLKVRLNGETIRDVEPELGYIHRSIEKMCESLSYRQYSHLTSRMDYLSSHINNQACALAVEQGLGVEIPERAKAIRILCAELTRLASHQLWWGCTGLDLGAVTPFFFAFRDREKIIEVFEDSCGARLTMNYMVPGGVMNDIHPDFVKKVKLLIMEFKRELHEYEELLGGNIIFKERMQGVGVLSKEDAIAMGCTGPVARASGVSCDIRKIHPYDGYEKLNFKEIVRTEGDCLARYKVRMDEMNESVSIIEQLIDNIPEGDFQAKTKNVIKIPKGEYYQRVETARGTLGVYIVSDGSLSPYRVKFRSPNFSNLFALPIMAKGGKIGDLIAIMSTLDLIIPDVDR